MFSGLERSTLLKALPGTASRAEPQNGPFESASAPRNVWSEL
jgi:hypothetical protein